ncbi:hypothetical protein ACQ4M4_03190 [Leptolyngbya sp. AN02str]|uniref:hypothetical protein n=1 Tax=Leptolyngbya sp. AN02str TaxID=3423363 RepID=UPI003D30FCD8
MTNAGGSLALQAARSPFANKSASGWDGAVCGEVVELEKRRMPVIWRSPCGIDDDWAIARGHRLGTRRSRGGK